MQMMDVDTSIHTPERFFSRHDRCDRCGFQGYIVAFKDNKELIFCHHHGTISLAALVGNGWSIKDFSEVLNE